MSNTELSLFCFFMLVVTITNISAALATLKLYTEILKSHAQRTLGKEGR